MYGLFVGGTKYLDRTGSMRADDFNQPQMVRNRAKKVSLFNVIILVYTSFYKLDSTEAFSLEYIK